MEILAISCALLAFLALVWMGWIDLKLWILPNELVFLYALTALPFHFAIDWYYGGWLAFVFGAVMGGGTLWVIRAAANKFYGVETLGLGDVKLMAAAGLWLGSQGILLALSVGAVCGVIHAIYIAHTQHQSLKTMMLPAGPGFIAGIILVSLWMYKDLLL